MAKQSSTRAFKIKVVQVIESGELRPARACREYLIAARRGSAVPRPHSRRSLARRPPDYDARIAEFERPCGQLAVENAALKKALQRLQSRPGTS